MQPKQRPLEKTVQILFRYLTVAWDRRCDENVAWPTTRVAILFFDKFKFLSVIDDLEAWSKLQALSTQDKSAHILR